MPHTPSNEPRKCVLSLSGSRARVAKLIDLPHQQGYHYPTKAMAGKSKAVQSGADLRDTVADLGRKLGLDAETEVTVGRRIWGAKRRIDVVLRHPETRRNLGVECKFQSTKGTAEEKIAGTIEDIRAWPIRGIVVFSGDGFSPNMKAYLLSTGVAVELPDAEKWLELYFGL